MLQDNEHGQNESVIAEELFTYVEKCGVSFCHVRSRESNIAFLIRRGCGKSVLYVQGNAVHLCAASDASDPVLPGDWQGPGWAKIGDSQSRNVLREHVLSDNGGLQLFASQLPVS